eukprot:scaffold16184_cov71-Phaeocystis_antarctica.AAC.4
MHRFEKLPPSLAKLTNSDPRPLPNGAAWAAPVASRWRRHLREGATPPHRGLRASVIGKKWSTTFAQRSGTSASTSTAPRSNAGSL